MTKEEEQDEKDPFLSFRTEQLFLFVISTIPPHPQNRGGGGGEIYRRGLIYQTLMHKIDKVDKEIE